MPTVAIVSIVAAAVTAAVLAGYFIALTVALRGVHMRLRAIATGLRTAPDPADGTSPGLETVTEELDRARAALDRLSGRPDGPPGRG